MKTADQHRNAYQGTDSILLPCQLCTSEITHKTPVIKKIDETDRYERIYRYDILLAEKAKATSPRFSDTYLWSIPTERMKSLVHRLLRSRFKQVRRFTFRNSNHCTVMTLFIISVRNLLEETNSDRGWEVNCR